MKAFIDYLTRMIDGCDSLGNLEREKAAYQSVLKEYRKQLNTPDVSVNEVEVCVHDYMEINACVKYLECRKCGHQLI